MKKAVIYATKTGNTRQVAEAIHSVFPEDTAIFPVEEAPDPETLDFLALGYWVDRGTANGKMRKYMERVKGKKVAIFGTLGAFPDSDHAKDVIKSVKEILKDNDIMGSFICQGKVDPVLVERMNKMPGHEMTPERKARLTEAAKHPNEDDFAKARKLFTEIVKTLG